MELKIVVPVDQKRALLAGRVLGPTCEITLNLESISAEVCKRIANELTFPPAGGVPTLPACWAVDDATQAAIVAKVEAAIESDREAATAKAEREQELLREAVRRLEEYERDGIHRTKALDYGYQWERWSINEPVVYQSAKTLPPDWDARIAARRLALGRIVTDHNTPHIAEVDRLRVEVADEAERQRAADKLAAESAESAAAAARLATGYWEIETGEYNERRHGAPWCARVTFPDGPKPVYEFADSTAKWGKAGILRVACRPGEIIAWGQKDLRNPGRGQHTIAVMEDDGRMREVTKTEAYRIWVARVQEDSL